LNTSRTDDTRLIDYSVILNGQARLDNAVLRLVKGIRGPRKHPIELIHIFLWFRGAPKPMILESVHRLLDSNRITTERGGYRLMTVSDMFGRGYER